ncbi:DHA1 family chloramphenicol resistance protein-like MFS transporter [Diaminobutyricimonas aerilata]|uniref:DHA1 family chloramphenicol resistance protein-like MFS transporter n=1 Tax=Diaminobutyricimonas aerilata TaxID=1162967 RepID=A0A2M9CGH2_9MICO|nr:Cmx/CmrA family chloramphenicol efflux MFS transporter [Diaminobutyricimonas aerilata]PJJ71024.1 DHA1 family chloramphenicol resistance protein-like MFS transporter [Diaminobutyricimonas aerilata]
MPFVIYLLSVAVFAQGTSEFMFAGLLAPIADELGVTVPHAGLLTSSFAVGILAGAPVMAVIARRWPPRRAWTGLLLLFIIAHIVGATTNDFDVLLVTRVVAAVANAGFLAVTLSTVSALVTPAATARALSVVLAGTTLALVAGVPGGAALGVALGWRSALWGVVVLCVPALVAVAVAAPVRATSHGRVALTDEWRALRRPRVMLAVTVTALVNGATFCGFTYLAPVVTGSAAMPAGAVPLVLAAFGIGAFLGVGAAGRIADAHPARLVAVGGALAFLGWVAFASAAHSPVLVIALAVTQGAAGFATGGALIARIMSLASGAPTLSGATATVALNIGAAAGPVLGGIAFAAVPGSGPLAASAALAAVALLLIALGRRALFPTEALR